MLIDIEYMVNRELKEKVEDLYTEYLGDDCDLEVNHIVYEDSTAIVVFGDVHFPTIDFHISENLNADLRKTSARIQFDLSEGVYQMTDLQRERDKFLRKHKKTIEAIKECWKIEFGEVETY